MRAKRPRIKARAYARALACAPVHILRHALLNTPPPALKRTTTRRELPPPLSNAKKIPQSKNGKRRQERATTPAHRHKNGHLRAFARADVYQDAESIKRATRRANGQQRNAERDERAGGRGHTPAPPLRPPPRVSAEIPPVDFFVERAKGNCIIKTCACVRTRHGRATRIRLRT